MNGLAAYAIERETTWSDELVEQYAPLVKRIAYHLLGRLPEHIQADDLIQAGMIGLLEAARNYRDGQGASFETYAGIRVRGAMLDEVRRTDWTPRSVHRKARELGEVTRAIEHREGREATEQEIIAELGIDSDEYHQILLDSSSHRLLSLDDLAHGQDESILDRLADNGPGVEDGLQAADLHSRLTGAIGELPERERLVMSLYYDEELNLKEIGAVLGVSESRVCQIHGRALLRLRTALAEGAQYVNHSG
ncbi:MAG: RNA polymerase sigma factor FliA [Gammaproteobacteria bacterium HGW-Gammaproteobacteria-1]|jgi:RNA polymerase sigma factor for flagellar operon FliA|nr:MAG: RNA polymerase sigma factor FliA [Gammaproteobacteria bacterium HGW-Gammaproteobacteria-1]